MAIKIGLIGYGYWGPNLLRNFKSHGDFEVKTVVDSKDLRLQLVNKSYPEVTTSTDVNDILKDPEIDAVAIATPVLTHFAFAEEALQNGKHVLLEKPMCASVQEAEELIELSLQKAKVLMVDHTFLYTDAVRKIKNLSKQGELGNLKYFDSTRINLGLFQPDVNVLWDLSPHDISILNFLVEEKPISLEATGICHTNNGLENIAYLTLNYASNFIAHISCSWSSPVKIRTTLIGGDKKMVVYNDIEPSEKIKIYDTGYTVKSYEDKHKLLIDYRMGDIFIPKLEGKEALFRLVCDFAEAIQIGSTPVSNFESGLSVVKILEASQLSIKRKGKETPIV